MRELLVSRKGKLIINTGISLLSQIVSIISGFVIPRSILEYFGSETNGLLASITQFLGFISFMQLGIGAVIQAAWYKPLNEKNRKETSEIYVYARKFFRTIAIIFCVYTLFVAIIYSNSVNTSYSNGYVFVLVIIVSINLFCQYFFGITNSLLLRADQKAYIPLIIETLVSILNIIISVTMIHLGNGILFVKLASNICCIISPILLSIYVNKYYDLDLQVKTISDPIKQKWSGFAQHLSAVVVDNTDIVVLTIFSSLSNISIYNAYHMVVSGMRYLLNSLTIGVQSLLGNMYVNDEHEKLSKTFNLFEIVFGFLITFLYASVSVLIVPFIKVYTKGINDANYNAPIFAVILTFAFAIYCYRTMYYTLIKAVGHFKQTQDGALIEAIINVLVSTFTVKQFGLIGVAIGTVIAITYRTIYCVWYLSRNIIYRKVSHFLYNFTINVVIYILAFWLTGKFEMESLTYISWIIMAIKVTIINLGICILIYGIAYKKYLIEIKTFICKQLLKR